MTTVLKVIEEKTKLFVRNIDMTINAAVADLISSDADNQLVQGTDDKLFVPESSGSGATTPYRLAVTVTSNNLTVALKNQFGDDPSPTAPVRVQIGDTVREIVAALSVTKNAATNWCNAGSSELATKEIDWFPYLGYNATDGVVIGFSRIPFARVYSDFSATTTNEKYCAISTITNAAAGDAYTVIGRFAATLSGGAGYTWTVPTFTAANLIHRPIYETRLLEWNPTVAGFSSPPATMYHRYRVVMDRYVWKKRDFSNGTSNDTVYTITAPFTSRNIDTNWFWGSTLAFVVNNGVSEVSGGWIVFNNSGLIEFSRNALITGWTNSGNKSVRGGAGEVEI
jgi:hypothetical protein